MQIINRIQNVTINTNATIQGVTVVGVMNAHRAHDFPKPCDPSPYKKGSEPGAGSSMRGMQERSQWRSALLLGRAALAGACAAAQTWRLQSRDGLVLANIDAAHDFHRARRD